MKCAMKILEIMRQALTYYSILLFLDVEPIILSKVAHYSQIVLHSERIVCKILPVLSCVQYKNDVKFLI